MLSRTAFILLGLLTAVTVGCSPTDLDNTLPVVTITSPAPHDEFHTGDLVLIEAEASDPDGKVVAVSFWVGNRRLGSDTEPPYSWIWDTTGEPLQRPLVRALASDDSGALSGDEVEVVVDWVYEEPEAVAGDWEVGTPGEVGLDSVPLLELINTIRRDPEHLIHGITIIRHGKMVLEKYFDGLTHPTLGETPISYDRETRHVLSSVTKSFTTTLLGVALQQGFISSVDEKALSFFPEHDDLNEGQKGEITLEHLATMTSGLEWDEWTLPLTDTLNSLTAFIGVAQQDSLNALRWYLDKPMVAAPGTTFTYSGGSSNLLGEIVGRAGGMPLNEFAGEYLFDPLGIDDFWYWVLPSGLVYASGALGLRPRDAARFGQMYLNGGSWNGVQLLPPGWVDLSAQPFVSFGPSFVGNGMVGYGYGWWAKSDTYGAGAFDAWGWGGQDIMVLPEHDMVVVITAGGYWEESVMSSHEMMLNYILPAIEPG